MNGESGIMEAEKVYRMDVSKVYPLLVSKAVKKGRTKAEVDKVTCWLTGYSQRELEELLSATRPSFRALRRCMKTGG